MTTRRADRIEETRAEALGIPVKRCPACEQIGAHWIPPTLHDDSSAIIPGRFSCQPVTVEEEPLW